MTEQESKGRERERERGGERERERASHRPLRYPGFVAPPGSVVERLYQDGFERRLSRPDAALFRTEVAGKTERPVVLSDKIPGQMTPRLSADIQTFDTNCMIQSCCFTETPFSGEYES